MTENKLIHRWQIRQDAGRIDKWLTAQLMNTSRNQVQKMIDESLVLVNQRQTNNRYKLKTNDLIEVFQKEQEEPLKILAENISIDIVYEDDFLLVVDKPAGMVVHPSKGHTTGTLVNALMFHSNKLSSSGADYRPGIVHRIDKDTSGLLIIAKRNDVHRNLQNQIQGKTAKRKYIALVQGVVSPNRGVIDAPLGRDPKNRMRRTVLASGKNALTHFKVLQRFDRYSLLELELATGRTHQIRAHLKYIKHPIINDPMYHKLNPNVILPGQMLHAFALEFTHPISKELFHFEQPLPQKFETSLKNLTKGGK